MLISGGQVAPLALADATPSFANRTYYPRSGIGLSNAFSTYAQVYRSQVWVAALVNKLAFGVARLPLKVYERGSEGRTEQRNTPLAKLLRNPNARHDPFFFWLWTVSTFEVYGEALWFKQRPAQGRPPTALYPIHPSNVATRRDDNTGELVYDYFRGTAQAPITTWRQDDVVHFKGYNPDDQVRGLSRLEPLRQTILNEDAARRASAAFWGNGGRPSMVMSHPTVMSQPAIDRFKAQVDALHSGVDNWGKTMILEEGMTPTVVPLNAEEMQYIESRKINREEACGIYDVPPPVVHILDRATFSNITEQMRSMYRDTMAPRLGLFESALDVQLRPDFDPQGNLYAEFLMDEVLRGSFEERAQAYQSLIASGVLMPNEARAMENRPGADGGDRLYINAGSIPLVNASDAPATGTNVEASPQKVKAIEGVTACGLCGAEGKTSNRGLCPSCEGRRGRALQQINAPKELG